MKKTMNYLGRMAIILAMVAAVSCGDDDELPKIDGYNNSNEVAKDNLKAHWTFDGDNKEALSGTAASNTYGTVGFEAGQIGQALKLTKGALVYPAISALNTADALANFTVSMWVNLKNNRGVTGVDGYTILFGLFPEANGDFMWGNINMAAETSWFLPGPVGDTLVLKGHFVNRTVDGVNAGQDNRPDPKGNPPKGVFKGAGKWVHFVARWDGTTHQFHIFGDKVSIGAYTDRGTAGPLRMNVPSKAIFGNGATKDVGFPNNPDQQSWSPMATASIDDVRVFNTALSDAEIAALFNLGSAGR